MALVTLSEYAQAHDLPVSNVRTARYRGKFHTAVKQHNIWFVDDGEPWYTERRRDWHTDEAKHLTGTEPDDMDRWLTIRQYAQCGKDADTFRTCLYMIPAALRDTLPAQQVAALVDAVSASYERGYNAGVRDAQ